MRLKKQAGIRTCMALSALLRTLVPLSSEQGDVFEVLKQGKWGEKCIKKIFIFKTLV